MVCASGAMPPYNGADFNMPVVKITPTNDYAVPFSTDAETPETFLEELAVVANTAELQMALGADLTEDVPDEPYDALGAELGLEGLRAKRDQSQLLASAAKHGAESLKTALEGNNPAPLRTLPTAVAAAAFLREYGSRLALDVVATRSAVTNKLLEIANCGDPKYELKALELLGKHSDIGLFTERSEITINHTSPEALEKAIKERVKRLLNADVIDATPVYASIDAELGFFTTKDELPIEDAVLLPLDGDVDEADESVDT